MNKKDELVRHILLENYESYYRLAFSYVHQEADAMDIVQEGAYKAMLKADTLREDSFAETWVYRIMINEAKEYLRKNRREYIEPDESLAAPEEHFRDMDLQEALEKLPERFLCRLLSAEVQRIKHRFDVQGIQGFPLLRLLIDLRNGLVQERQAAAHLLHAEPVLLRHLSRERAAVEAELHQGDIVAAPAGAQGAENRRQQDDRRKDGRDHPPGFLPGPFIQEESCRRFQQQGVSQESSLPLPAQGPDAAPPSAPPAPGGSPRALRIPSPSPTAGIHQSPCRRPAAARTL